MMTSYLISFRKILMSASIVSKMIKNKIMNSFLWKKNLGSPFDFPVSKIQYISEIKVKLKYINTLGLCDDHCWTRGKNKGYRSKIIVI